MKPIIYLVVLCLGLSSCAKTFFNGTTTPEQPYVILKTGKRIEGSTVDKKEGTLFTKGKVTIDGKTYKPGDVSMYSDGTNTYANVAKNEYGIKVFGDSINVYRTEKDYSSYNAAKGETQTQNRVHYYVQAGSKNNKPVFKPFVAKNVKNMIPANSAGADHLKKHNRQVKIARYTLFGGLGMLAGGVILAVAGGNSDAAVIAGASMILLSVPAMITSMGIGGGARKHLFKAVEAHNTGNADVKKKKFVPLKKSTITRRQLHEAYLSVKSDKPGFGFF